MKKYTLLVISILMIIVNPILIFFTNIIILMENSTIATINIVLDTFFISIITSLISGILGILAFRKPKKVNICLVVGSIHLTCNTIQLTMLTLKGFFDLALLCFIFSSTIPLFYIIFAYLFKNFSEQKSIKEKSL